MSELAVAAGAALVVGIILGGMAGFKLAKKRLAEAYEDVRSEAVRMRRIAEEKLADDEPELNVLLRKLNDAVADTFKAAAALEDHEKTVLRKTEGGKEVLSLSREIIRLIDDLDGSDSEAEELTIKPPPKLSANGAADKKPTPRLR